MKQLLALNAFVGLPGGWSTAEPPAATGSSRVDAFGDPLPPGALFRLGCTRLHHLGDISDLRFSADGRSLTTIDSASVIPPGAVAMTWSIATGKETRRMKLEVSAGPFIGCKFSTVGDRIWAVFVEDFLLFSAADGKLLLQLKTGKDTAAAHVSLDAKRLILLDDEGEIRHADGQRRRVTRTVALSPPAKEKYLLRKAAFSRDGKWLAAFCTKNRNGTLQIWDMDSGKQVHLLKENNANALGLAFSPDSLFVAGVFYHRPDFPIVIWDLKTGREVQRLRVTYPKVPEIFSLSGGPLCFSPDGAFLAYVEDSFDRERVWVWDVKTGKVRHRLKALLRPPSQLVFSPDGKTLAGASSSGAVLIWDLASGKLVHDVPEIFNGPIHYLGEKIAAGYASPGTSAAQPATGVWDVGMGRRVLTLPGKILADASSSSQLLAIYDAVRTEPAKSKQPSPPSAVVDVTTGMTRWQSSKLGSQLRFSGDGKKLVGFAPTLQILDPWTGRELSRFKVKNSPQGKGQKHSFSPDLRYAVISDVKRGEVRLLDLASGRQLWQSTRLPTTEGGAWVIRFSPDGELLAVGDYKKNFWLWKTSTGKQLVRAQHDGVLVGFLPDCRTLLFQRDDGDDVPDPHVSTFSVAHMTAGNDYPGHISVNADYFFEGRGFLQTLGDLIGGYSGRTMSLQRDLGSIASADSKILVTAADPYVIQLWETATGKLLFRLHEQRDGAQLPVLAPDCRTLTTRNANDTITVWDLTGLRLAERTQPLPLSAAEFERSWKAFADERDGESFFRAYWKLAADSDQTVSRLRERLKPSPATDPKRINDRIAELDNSDFGRRARATKELEGDESALPILRETLKKRLSVEVQQRMTRIVRKLESGPKRGPEVLRVYRLVQLLEQIGSRAARDLLQTFSNGAAETMLAAEARASLRRLDSREQR